jgi:hypothetical protein
MTHTFDRGFYLSLLKIFISGVVLLGSLIAYTETKFTSKEAHLIEVDQRKTDVREIKELILKQNDKLDRIYIIMLRGGK